ncbi:hypothetical protein QYS49_38995 [Marivirga salinae]|uniref:Uncharacterized protein n=1 Tax=Marivirga salinarum TaxID=3059078 RepID=A0AA51NDI7_9BACT|nr:hypothetical protein [Marivirga sp. BDSF4-3]WMN11606.1 hypothetical protein QYS49_38995 [Marivirga sp. BDSF4-3]
MRQVITIFLIIFISAHSFAQGKWSIDHEIIFDRYIVYEGAIDEKYPIIMRLEESSEACTNMASKWTPRLVYGWYMYKKIGKKIPLVGSVCYTDQCESSKELFVPSDPINYSFTDKCQINEFKEQFIQQKGDQDFLWKQKDGDTYPVKMNIKHEFSWKTTAILKFQINDLTISEINLTQLSKNDYIERIKTISQKRASGKFHILIQYSHQSNPGSYGHGSCGAGLEEYAAHLTINESFEIESFDKLLYRSCINNIFEIKAPYDVEKPELGLITKE